jgi:predicted nucleotidyltransferase
VIVNDYRPEKIILFSSLVSGDIHYFSDIDLIVIKDSQKSFYERLKEIILLTMPSVAADIFVYTPDEFENIQDRLFIQEEVSKKDLAFEALNNAKKIIQFCKSKMGY